MALLQPYRGRFVSARSASEKIDAEAIIAGCYAVDSEASMISTIESEVNSSGSMITPEVLAIGEKNILATLEEVCTGISNAQMNIQTVTANIRQQAEAIYNQMQSELNEEASRRDQAEIDAYNRQVSERRGY